MASGDAVEPRLLLLRIAVVEHLLKLIKHAGIKHCDLAILELSRVLARLEESLNFGGRKSFASGSCEFVFEIEPIFPRGPNLEARLDAFDVAGHVGKAGANRYFPLLFQARQVAREKRQDLRFAL